jgi:CRP-like cAMP-binding protein
VALTAVPPQPRDNRLLAALPHEDYERLLPQLARVTWALGEVLYEPDRALAYLYFPTTTIVSLVYTMVDGATAEMGMVGSEGVVGVALFMGGNTTPNRAVVQVAGDAFRLEATALHVEFQRGGALQLALLRYTQALLTQISQTAVCNQLHLLEKRLCRWLLLTYDRVPTAEVLMTHELLAHMLGVRRESVTMAAGHLQEMGFIRYGRGHITILDRQGLEAMVCECYRVVKDEYTRLLG